MSNVREVRPSRGGRGRSPVAPDWQSTAGNDAPSVDDTRYSTVEITDLTKAELMQLCRDRGLPVSGKKQDLIDRLEE